MSNMWTAAAGDRGKALHPWQGSLLAQAAIDAVERTEPGLVPPWRRLLLHLLLPAACPSLLQLRDQITLPSIGTGVCVLGLALWLVSKSDSLCQVRVLGW
uniref:Uncharacterized protein n=1 Tax=Alexandrium andersonii TaxID=327968 RepID=A0A7S2FKG4_9DINO